MPPRRTALKDKPSRAAEVAVLDRRPSRRQALCHQDQATLRPISSHETHSERRGGRGLPKSAV